MSSVKRTSALLAEIAELGAGVPIGGMVEHYDELPPDATNPFTAMPVALGILFAWPIWATSRLISQRKGRFHFCPTCWNMMGEPLVYCERCGRALSRLEPGPGSVFKRTCVCGGRSWPILGQFRTRVPQPLVCRSTIRTRSREIGAQGCLRPLPPEYARISGKVISRHVAIAGSSMAAKHAVMGRLFPLLQTAGLKPLRRLDELEVELCGKTLVKAFDRDTSRCEFPGGPHSYSLCGSLMLREPGALRAGRGKLRVYHNLTDYWLNQREGQGQHSSIWQLIDGLIFIIDVDDPGANPEARAALDADLHLLERLARLAERSLDLHPGQRLPYRAAAILASRDQPADETAEETARRRVPGFYAMARRLFPNKGLKLFAGSFSRSSADESDPDSDRELRRVADWVSGRGLPKNMRCRSARLALVKDEGEDEDEVILLLP